MSSPQLVESKKRNQRCAAYLTTTAGDIQSRGRSYFRGWSFGAENIKRVQMFQFSYKE